MENIFLRHRIKVEASSEMRKKKYTSIRANKKKKEEYNNTTIKTI
jgi:hypothetical protein